MSDAATNDDWAARAALRDRRRLERLDRGVRRDLSRIAATRRDRAPDDGAVWGSVVAELDAIAERIGAASRNLRLGPVSRALGRHTAAEIASCAAELAANIAILESADV